MPRHELTSRVLQWRMLTKAFRVHQGWIGSCWIRASATAAQGLWQNLSKLGRSLAVELAAVSSAAMPDVTADFESSAQPAAQRVVLDPSSRLLSSKVPAAPSDASLELTSWAR